MMPLYTSNVLVFPELWSPMTAILGSPRSIRCPVISLMSWIFLISTEISEGTGFAPLAGPPFMELPPPSRLE